MVEYLIKDSKDLLNHISKWNLSVQKYPDNFPKDKIQPLPYTFNSVKDYREVSYKYIFILSDYILKLLLLFYFDICIFKINNQ